MTKNADSKISAVITKIKDNKKLQIAIASFLVVVMFLIFFSTTSSFGFGAKNNDDASADSYVLALEKSLSSTLSNIAGAGNVNVMIAVEGGPIIEIAYTTEERKNTSSGTGSSTDSVTIVKTPVLVTKNGVSQPIILSETNPKIVGVIIIASGASDIKVRLELLRAAQSVLKIDVNSIEIFVGK